MTTNSFNLATLAFVSGVSGILLGLAVRHKTNEIKYFNTSLRASAMVIHNDTVYLSGQVGKINQESQALDGDIQQQTRETLDKIDKLLAEAGTDKTKILSTQIWLKDIKNDFAPMNEIWNNYMKSCGDTKTVRACVESAMARPSILVEIQVVATL
ncbi:hypothetical protein TrST_g9948 [Triparma strigata]|uniref:RidA family protein n=1 Tax=Triparma strigata TaxID=1606541 RepID=A0A9W7B8R6_9STRA|nr:hypothetical protein TrST_g9948 [Triparma strigata]